MGKRIISQRRGRGGQTYKAPSFNYKGAARHRTLTPENMSGVVVDLVKCRGHSAPLALIEYEDNEYSLILAPESIQVGQRVTAGDMGTRPGSTLKLQDLPDGALVYNIEGVPGDGGKFCRAAGAYAKIVSRTKERVVVQLPSKRRKEFPRACRANLGVISGGGRGEKPLVKAGNKYHKMRAKNKLYPIVSGTAMNAVDHPFGNARSARKARAIVASRHAPPGRKVGMVAARKTGRKKK